MDLRYFHLTTLASVPFRNRRSFDRILGGLNRVDEALFRFGPIRKHAWMVIIAVSEPKRSA